MKKRCWSISCSRWKQSVVLTGRAAIAHMRFDFIENICDETVVKPQESKEHLRSVKIDKILTGKYTAIPCFIAIMGLVFFLTFGCDRCFFTESAGSWVLMRWRSLVDQWMTAANVNSVIQSLVMDGIFTRRGKCPEFPADHRYTVFLLVYAGRQRIYGKGGFCDG